MNGKSQLYHPKADHPWRRYKNKFNSSEAEKEAIKNLPSLKNFLQELVENWESYQIYAGDYEETTCKIRTLPDPRVADWLVTFVRRTWVNHSSYTPNHYLPNV
jgi:arginyl-tRNA--protein-N-Asp/Glu arginylyltransferase